MAAVDNPPRSITGEQGETATFAQVVAVVGDRLGEPALWWRVRDAILDLIKAKRIAPNGGQGHMREFAPRDVYVIVGEMVRRGCAWNRRRDVAEGFDAWVDDELGARIMQLPWERHWDRAAKREVTTMPDEIPCVEFPTGLITGRLLRVGSERDGLPVYRREEILDSRTY